MLAGMTRAAPAPMTARHAVSSSADVDNAAPSEAAPKTAIPLASAPRRPNLSPAQPAGTSRVAKDSV